MALDVGCLYTRWNRTCGEKPREDRGWGTRPRPRKPRELDEGPSPGASQQGAWPAEDLVLASGPPER